MEYVVQDKIYTPDGVEFIDHLIDEFLQEIKDLYEGYWDSLPANELLGG